MTVPLYEVLEKRLQNPQASGPLIIPIRVTRNTPDEDIQRNIRASCARDIRWVCMDDYPQKNTVAVIVGGGPSVKKSVDDIRARVDEGAIVYAVNGASGWLQTHGICPDYQVITDAKPESASLVDPMARVHLIASQCHSGTFEAASRALLFHMGTESIEPYIPDDRRGHGYAIVAGGAVGISATALAYAMGHRELHIYGLDSCHDGEASHAYDQPMNRFVPTVDVEWAGRTFTASVAMKAQAEKFQVTAQRLKALGCVLHVHGDGLLQHMYTAPPELLTERDKYRTLWQFEGYRDIAPGEFAAPFAAALMEPPGPVIDFGCGTGRGALALGAAGYEVICLDFADNCRDNEALHLPFVEWDLARPIPLRAPFGFCTDVMEHIPPDHVEAVIGNIMTAADRVFFQISTVEDLFGGTIGQTLHLTVRPYEWWESLFTRLGYDILVREPGPGCCAFYIGPKGKQ